MLSEMVASRILGFAGRNMGQYKRHKVWGLKYPGRNAMLLCAKSGLHSRLCIMFTVQACATAAQRAKVDQICMSHSVRLPLLPVGSAYAYKDPAQRAMQQQHPCQSSLCIPS